MRAYKCEGRAEELLKRYDGLEYFIPKRYAVQVYHGRKVRRLVPIIPSLLFIHASQAQIIEFKKSYNFLQYMMYQNTQKQWEYITVPDTQMQDFIRVVSQYEEDIAFFKPEEINLEKGTRVRIIGGKFDGVEATFLKVKGFRKRRVVVMLGGVMAASVEVEPDLIEVIQ